MIICSAARAASTVVVRSAICPAVTPRAARSQWSISPWLDLSVFANIWCSWRWCRLRSTRQLGPGSNFGRFIFYRHCIAGSLSPWCWLILVAGKARGQVDQLPTTDRRQAEVACGKPHHCRQSRGRVRAVSTLVLVGSLNFDRKFFAIPEFRKTTLTTFDVVGNLILFF